jgi:hypothetical protein
MALSIAFSDMGLANGRPAWAMRETLGKIDTLPHLDLRRLIAHALVGEPLIDSSGWTSELADADAPRTCIAPVGKPWEPTLRQRLPRRMEAEALAKVSSTQRALLRRAEVGKTPLLRKRALRARVGERICIGSQA